MIKIETLTPAWRRAFLDSRNSLFTPITTESWDRAAHSAFPVRTYLARDESKVMSWGSFFLRGLELGRSNARPLQVAMACAIGTLPDYQRQGLGKRVWRVAEESLAREVDGVLVYTNEGGEGYTFYRAMGYLPLAYPRSLQRIVSDEPHAEPSVVRTAPFSQSRDFSNRREEVFADCYRGYGGFMANRPTSLDRWADASFFYDPTIVGCSPQISWLEDPSTGRWTAYAIWAGPIEKVPWKKGAVEIWELACAEICGMESLRRLLQPVCAAANAKKTVEWWAAPNHPLAERMLALGFEEKPRSLCVLGKVFDPARMLADPLQTGNLPARQIECKNVADRRVDLRLDDCSVEIERDAAMRMVFGRSTASLEYQHGVLTIHPSRKTQPILEILDRALPVAPWSYFASEFI